MKAKLLVPLAICAVLIAVIVISRSGRKPAEPVTPVESAKAIPPAALVSNRSSDVAVTNDSLLKLRLLASNASMTAEGATASYEVRQLIADRLSTNEAFLRWATNATRTTVWNLVTNKSVAIYGVAGLSTNQLKIHVAVKAVGGLLAEAIYDPNTNSEGPLTFVIEGGTNPVVGMVQNRYRMAAYQLDPAKWGSPEYPRNVGRTDWESANTALDANQIEAMASAAYYAMVGNPMPGNFRPQIDTSAVTDPMVQDPAVQVTGKPGAVVATMKNQRYPFASFVFGDAETGVRPFSGEMLQAAPGQAQIVKLFLSPDDIRNAVIDLGDTFLSSSSTDWAEEVLAASGSTTADEVLKKMWKMPNR